MMLWEVWPLGDASYRTGAAGTPPLSEKAQASHMEGKSDVQPVSSQPSSPNSGAGG